MWRRIVTLGLLGAAALSLLELAAFPLQCQASVYEPQPVLTGPTAYTQKDLREAALRFNRRTMVEAYRQVGRHSPNWDEAAVRFLDTWAQIYAGVLEVPKWDGLVQDGQRLVESGCDDPLVVYCYGRSLQGVGKVNAAWDVLVTALPGLQESKYPPIRSAFAAMRLADIAGYHSGRESKEAMGYWNTGAALVARAVRENTYQQDEQRVFLLHINDEWHLMPLAGQRALYTALKQEKATDPYVLAVVGGMEEVEEAWAARGTGWADEVTAAGWRGFAEHLGKARILLTKAWKAHPDWPEAPAWMINVAGGGHAAASETIRTWFDRAVAAQLDYASAYRNMLWFSRPRWGGSHDEMYHFGVECLETGRFDTDVPLWFLKAVRDIAQDIDGDKVVWHKQETRQHLATMFEGYLKDATGTRRAHFQTIQAAAAWRAERYDEARKLLDELGTDVHEEVFSDWFNTSYATAQGQIHAFSGPQGATARRAQRLADAGKTEQALASYEAVTKAGVSDPVARSYVESRVRALRFQQQLSTGSWVELRPDAEFDGWRKANGAWVLEEDGTIRGTSAKDGLWLGWDQRIDAARPSALPAQAPKADNGVAFAGEMQLVASGREEAPNCAVEVELGGGSKVDSIIWAVSGPKQEVMLTHTAGGEGTVYAPAQVTDWSTFRVEVWKNRVTTYLNGKLVNREVKMGTARPGAAIRVSVGSYSQYADVVVRFRNLRVRRLTKKPTVSETLPKE